MNIVVRDGSSVQSLRDVVFERDVRDEYDEQAAEVFLAVAENPVVSEHLVTERSQFQYRGRRDRPGMEGQVGLITFNLPTQSRFGNLNGLERVRYTLDFGGTLTDDGDVELGVRNSPLLNVSGERGHMNGQETLAGQMHTYDPLGPEAPQQAIDATLTILDDLNYLTTDPRQIPLEHGRVFGSEAYFSVLQREDFSGFGESVRARTTDDDLIEVPRSGLRHVLPVYTTNSLDDQVTFTIHPETGKLGARYSSEVVPDRVRWKGFAPHAEDSTHLLMGGLSARVSQNVNSRATLLSGLQEALASYASLGLKYAEAGNDQGVMQANRCTAQVLGYAGGILQAAESVGDFATVESVRAIVTPFLDETYEVPVEIGPGQG